MHSKETFNYFYKKARAIQSEAISICATTKITVPTSVVTYAAGRIEELEASEAAARVACANAENDFKVLLATISRKTGMSVKEIMESAFPNREY